MLTKNTKEILDELGFDYNSIVETIFVTKNEDGTSNPAPMGIVRTHKESLEIRPFISSKTYQNLQNNCEGCINITTDPVLFLATAFKEIKINGINFGKIDQDLRLLKSDAHIFVEVIKNQKLSEYRSKSICRPLSIEITNYIPKAFSRGKSQAIEAIIHSTRIKVYSNIEDKKSFQELIEKYERCRSIVLRVSSSVSDEIKIINILDNLIKKWLQKN